MGRPVCAEQPLADIGSVRSAVRSLIDTQPALGYELVRLAWQCASTFRTTDYQGGCDGARVRHPPQSAWAENAGLDAPLATLAPVKQRFGEGLSWADLIVLAGTTAVEAAGGRRRPFCGGRVDATRKMAEEDPVAKPPPPASDVAMLRADAARMGLTLRELVALHGRPMASRHAVSEKPVLSHRVYAVLLRGDGGLTAVDALLDTDPELAAIAESFASDGARASYTSATCPPTHVYT